MRLIDVIDTFISGDWGNEVQCEDAPCEVYCVRGADIEPIKNQDYNHIPKRYVSKHSFEIRLLQAGDIIVEKSGGSPTQSTGRVCLITGDIISNLQSIDCSNFCTAFRVKKEWDAEYIYLYIQHVYNAGVFFNFEGKTSGLKNLQLEQAYSAIEVPNIPLLEQKRIAKVINTIDSKMAVNRVINQNLEAMVKQLYDYWFVQFDFPNKEGKPYRSNGGGLCYNNAIKRNIPSDWTVCSIDEVCTRVQSGGTPSTSNKEFYAGSTAWYSTQELQDKWLIDSIKHISEEAIENSSAKVFPRDSVVIAIYASPTVGRLGLLSEPSTFNQACCGLVVNDSITKEYLFMYLRESRTKLNTLADGTAQKNLNVGKIKSFPIMVPSNDVIHRWKNVTESIFNALRENEKESLELRNQRDELLPLLMNGQVSLTQLNSDLSAY